MTQINEPMGLASVRKPRTESVRSPEFSLRTRAYDIARTEGRALRRVWTISVKRLAFFSEGSKGFCVTRFCIRPEPSTTQESRSWHEEEFPANSMRVKFTERSIARLLSRVHGMNPVYNGTFLAASRCRCWTCRGAHQNVVASVVGICLKRCSPCSTMRSRPGHRKKGLNRADTFAVRP